MGVIAKRHFYECGGETLSWRSEWYTQPWFTALRQSYDSAASTGPVNPPLDVIETVARCSSLLQAESDALSSVVATATGVVLTTSSVMESGVVSGSLVPATRTTVFTVAASATPSITSGSSGLSGSYITTSGSSSTWSSITAAVSSSTSSSSSASPSAVPAALVASTNSCAGDWDWQAWGMVANLGFAIIVGGIIWLVWALLRGRMPGLYAGRTWFVPLESRPSRPWSLLGFILPFLHLPSLSSPASLSEGHLGLHSMLAALKLAAVPSLVSLAAVLPLYMVNTPCLDATSPSNTLGGRTGSLTDISLLRLLNSLDPSPGSQSTSSQLHLQAYIRALPSTIAPAIGSARVRLIVLLIVITVLGCGGGLFVLFRAYTAFARYHKRFELEICGGMDMVIIPLQRAKAWSGLSEEGIQKWIDERGLKGEDAQMRVAGVFGIPDTSAWKAKIQERDEVLNKLEEAEVRYIQSFRLVQTPSNGRRLEAMQQPSGTASGSPRTPDNDFIGPKDYYRLSSGRSKAEAGEPLEVIAPVTPPTPPVPAARPTVATTGPGVQDSKFREINRDSAFFGRLPIGQRIRVNSQGQFSPESSPDDESSNPLGTPGPDARQARTHSIRQSRKEALPQFQPGPGRHPEVHAPATAAAMESETPSHDSSPLGQHYHDIRAYRSLFKSLNGEIEVEQQRSWSRAAKGEDVLGWVIVGRGARWLPGAQRVDGASREDILWENVGKSRGTGLFWAKMVGVAIIVAAIMAPFIGLPVATAPGFAHYLGFLQPLADSEGFGSGVVEGLVPAIALTSIMGGAVFAINRFARQTKVISRSHQRFLAYQGTFYLTICTTLLWMVTAAALEYGVQGLATDVQAARFVGDGAVFSTWFVFVAMLNVAIIAPALYLLQPMRLARNFLRSRTAITPRQNFRRKLPPSFNPSFALLPFLVAVFYAFSLVFLFPLLALPVLLLIFLGLVANRYMVDYVLVERIGYTGATFSLWTIRRFGWVLGVQPALYGLILLSRREWALGGASLGVACITVILSELATVRRYRRDTARRLSASDRQAIDRIADDMAQHRDSYTASVSNPGRSRTSDASMLSRLAALLPGYSRLPSDCPLPLQTENVDDLFCTERAAYARPSFARKEQEKVQAEAEARRFFHDPTESIRGLVYPDEILAPIPVIWLPNDDAGVAVSEAADLESYHGLSAIVDPENVNEMKGKGKQRSGQSNLQATM